jgi:uncharacterized small protein (DUF1192 family)
MFRELLEYQRDVYDLTLKQYRYGSLLESCAVEAGLKPQAMVTLNTDVLGRLVFSSLGRNGEQAGGQSEQDREQFMRMTVRMLDRGGKLAQEHGDALFDPSLSNSEKASRFSSSVVREFGGPVPFALATASLLTNVAQVAKQGFDLKAKNQMEEELNQIKVIAQNIDSKLTTTDPKDLIPVVVREYTDIKKKQDDLVTFFQVKEKNSGDQNEIARAKANLKELQKLFTTLSDRNYTANQPNIDTALLFWLSSNFESLKILIDGGKKPDDVKIPDDIRGDKGQEKLTAIIQRISEVCNPGGQAKPAPDDLAQAIADELAKRPGISEAEITQLKNQLTKEHLEKSCTSLLNTFRRESVALRFVLQKLLSKPPA